MTAITHLTNAISGRQYAPNVIRWVTYQECVSVTRLYMYPNYPNGIIEELEARMCMICHRSKFWIGEILDNHSPANIPNQVTLLVNGKGHPLIMELDIQ